MGPYPLRVALALRIQVNKQSDSGVEVSTQYGMVYLGNHRFIPGLSEL